MNLKYFVAGILVVLLLVGGLGGVADTVTDVAPATDPASERGSTSERESASESQSEGEVDSRSPEPTAEPMAVSEPAFSFIVNEIENCGLTCRDVTATITNTATEPASDVTVTTTLYAGENSTDPEAQVWEGTEAVGTLDGGDSYATADRIELSFTDARTIQQHDGWITIRTTVDAEERTTTFQRSRQVA